MRLAGSILVLLAALASVALLVSRSWAASGGYASAYGPGLYGGRLACGGRLTPSTLGVAHRWHSCGRLLRVCYRGRCQLLRVRDRGPYVAGRSLDLTEAAARRFGARSAAHWGVRYVTWAPAR